VELGRYSLLLADISGYTNFMTQHRSSLLHAERIVTDLIEAVVDATGEPVAISKLEGDAVFFYAPAGEDPGETARQVAQQAQAAQRAFVVRQRELVAAQWCRCTACDAIEDLRLKLVLHHGEAVRKQIRGFDELGGEAVIVLHRLVKSSVPSGEYLMMTRAFERLTGGIAGRTAEQRTEHCEGIGPIEVAVYYPDDAAALPAPEPAPRRARVAEAARFSLDSTLCLLGLRNRAFANLPA
jgi:hypothetical protein